MEKVVLLTVEVLKVERDTQNRKSKEALRISNSKSGVTIQNEPLETMHYTGNIFWYYILVKYYSSKPEMHCGTRSSPIAFSFLFKPFTTVRIVVGMMIQSSPKEEFKLEASDL